MAINEITHEFTKTYRYLSQLAVQPIDFMVFWQAFGFCTALVQRHWRELTVLMLILISWLSLRTPEQHTGPVNGIDKLYHLVAYAGLVVPVALAKPKNWLFQVLGLFGFSAAIEIVQPWFSRTTDIVDLFANATGLILGTVMALLVNEILNRRMLQGASKSMPVSG